jgi:ribosomal protein S18 acetylase RimI-like enzyme
MASSHTLIRPANPEDAAQVLSVHIRARTTYYRGYLPDETIAQQNQRSAAHYEAIIRNPARSVRVAESRRQVVGFLMIGPCYYTDPDPAVTSELYQIHVEPDHFRRGIGSSLHAAGVAIWKAAEVTSARLWAWDFNARARAFYLARGWVPDGHTPPDGPQIGQHRMMSYRLDLDQRL